MIAAMTALSDRFFTAANGWNIMRQISVNLCLSIGMTMVIVAGGIDLSVGSILALAGAVTAGLIKLAVPIPWLGVQLEFTVHGAILTGLLVGMFLGWFNGLMIT
jgi:ribose transport system permease protein